MRFAAVCFLGFSLFVLVVIGTVVTLNHELPFMAAVFLVFGGIAFCSVGAAWQMWARRSLAIGYALTGILSVIILVGWLQHGSLELDEPIHPVLHVLRTIAGLYVVLLWVPLIRASILAKRRSREGTTNSQPAGNTGL
jgi:hypothetical protein